MKRKKVFSVSVYYDGYDRTKDDKIRTVAKEFKGEDVGSGFGFGERDVEYEFKSETNASKFQQRMKKFKWARVNDITDGDEEI